jgi:hypothetical protein
MNLCVGVDCIGLVHLHTYCGTMNGFMTDGGLSTFGRLGRCTQMRLQLPSEQKLRLFLRHWLVHPLFHS